MRILIIEANNFLIKPYSFLKQEYQISRVSTIEKAEQDFLQIKPDVVMINASFKPEKILDLLEKIKNESYPVLIPIIFVIDLNQALNFIPGTYWGGKIGIVYHFTSRYDFSVMWQRLTDY